jgi:hypothetical protein
MDTIIPATGEWSLCLDNPAPSAQSGVANIFRVPILGWEIGNPGALPVPITPFGPADTSDEYLVQCASDANAMFIVLPNGPMFAGNDFNQAKTWLRRKVQAAVSGRP